MRDTFLLAKIVAPIFNLVNAVPIKQATLNQLWAATSTKAESGKYYDPVGQKSEGSQLSGDMTLAGKLWQWTEEELSGAGLKDD